MKKAFFILFLLPSFCLSLPLKEFNLPNGARAIIYKKTSPLFCVQFWIKKKEGRFLGTGVAHLVEHLLFREKGKELQKLGAQTRGLTGADYIMYEALFPKEHFLKGLEKMFHMIFSPQFNEEEIEKEKLVVEKEMRMMEDDPLRCLYKRFYGTHYSFLPYKHPVIGYKDALFSLKKEDIEEYHRNNYTASNTVVVLVIDEGEEEILEFLKDAFKDLERGELIEPSFFEPPPLRREVFEYFDTHLSYILIGFPAPSAREEDAIALDVLAASLGEGEASVLSVLKEKGIVHEITCFNISKRLSGIFFIQATTEKEPKKVMQAIFKELKKVKEKGVSEKDIKRAKALILNECARTNQSPSQIAEKIGISTFLLDLSSFLLKDYLGMIKEVDAKKLKSCAEKYLKEETCTIVFLCPKREEKKEEVGERKEGIHYFTLKNGVHLVVGVRKTPLSASACFVFKGGVRAEEPEWNGAFNLISSLLLSGTKKMDKKEIEAKFEEMGAKVSAFSGNNTFGIKLDTLSENIDEAIRLVASCIQEATFAQKEIDKKREQIIREIEEGKKDIFFCAQREFQKKLWKKHPYRLSPLGEKESLLSIKREFLLKLYRRFCVAENLVISVFGDVDVDRVKKIVDEAFGNMKGRAPIIENEEEIRIETERCIHYMDRAQVIVMIGFTGPKIIDEERASLDVLGALMEGDGGRLFEDLRNKRGLCYAVGTYSILGPEAGAFVFYAVTSQENARECEEALFSHIKRLKEELVEEEELQRAKNALLTKLSNELFYNSSNALLHALSIHYGIEQPSEYLEKIKKIDATSIKNTAEKYFTSPLILFTGKVLE